MRLLPHLPIEREGSFDRRRPSRSAGLLLLGALLGSATFAAGPVAAQDGIATTRVVVTGIPVSQLAALDISPRHVLDELQFSAELTTTEIGRMQLLGGVVTATATRALEPIVDDGEDAQVSGRGDGGKPKPADPVPWGVERVVLGTTSGNNVLPAGNDTAGSGITVAVIDTGVDTNHPDLLQAVHLEPDGCYNLVIATPGPGCEDDNGHGTHVAGTIAARPGSASGIWGVAPGASLMVLKACDATGKCASDDIAASIRRAVDGGAKVISMSFTASASTVEERAAYDYAAVRDVVLVGAAGNSSGNTACTAVGYPAASSRVISVGATDKSNAVPSYSCRGNNLAAGHKMGVREDGEIEVAAPGSSVASTAMGGGYASMSGTSMATPHIAGLVARLLPAFGGKGYDVRTWLTSTGDDITGGTGALPGEDSASGRGLPDVP